jgi:diguanylate cyclase (GGDEF)-like protein
MLNRAIRRFATGGAVLVLLCVLAGCKRSPRERAVSFHDIVVADARASTRGQRVRNTGIVTYSDPEWHLLFLQDQEDGVYLEPHPNSDLRAGDLVQIDGTTTLPAKLLENTSFSVLSRKGPLPPAINLANASEFPNFPSKFVETVGTVRWAGIRAGRATLEVFAGDRRFETYVYPGTIEDLPQIGSKVKIAGVSAADYDGDGHIRSLRLLTPGARYIKVLDPGPADPFALPVKKLSDLNSVPSGFLVHLQGQVLSGNEEFSVADGKHAVPMNLHDPMNGGFKVADVAGFWSGHSLDDAMVRPKGEHVSRQGDIVHLSELKHMSVEAAAEHRGVSVRAVVTYLDPYWHLLFVQDETSAAFVNLSGLNLRLHPGDLVDVSGVSSPGDFAPVIAEPAVNFVGRGQLPLPLKLDLVQGNLAEADSRWCKVRGVVHTAQVQDGHTILKLGAGQTALSLVLPTMIRGDQLVDKEISATGALGILFNDRRQALGQQIFVPAPEFLTIVGDGGRPNHPSTIASLRQYAPDSDERHSVILNGTVVLKSSEKAIFIQDQTAGIQVRALSPVNVSDGEHVSVRGFIVQGEYSPVLEDAVVLRESSGSLPNPEQISAKSAGDRPHDSEYVSMQGVLAAVRSSPNGTTLALNDKGTFFEAIGPARNELNSLRIGSQLVVRGICQVTLNRNYMPFSIQGFTLTFDSPQSVSVIKLGPWWNSDKITWALLVILVVAAAASLWAALLQQQVGIQTRKLQSSLEAAHKSKQFDVARNEVLESIARNAPLPESMERLAFAIEEQIPGSVCAIVMPPDGRSFLNGKPSPVLIAPGLPEELHPVILPALSSVLAPSADDINSGRTDHDFIEGLLDILRQAGLSFKAGQTIIVFSGTGAVAGLLILLLTEGSSAESEAARQNILHSASRLVSLARDHWHMHDNLLHDARHDKLTGLPNRAVAEDRLEQALARAERRRKLFAIFCIDLDGFKGINDELGHEVGDDVLRMLSARLRGRIRLSDTVARIGGDEFLAIIEDCSGDSAAQAVAESLITALQEPVWLEGRELKISGSIGIAMYPADGENASQLKRNADQAMYRAKSQGGSQISFWAGEPSRAGKAAQKSSGRR